MYLMIGVISSVMLFKVERSKNNPLIEFRDFSNLMFYAGAVLCFLAGALSAVALFFDPLYLQVIREQSPQLSGLVLLAIPVAVFIAAFFVGWLIHQLGIINTIVNALLLAILACLLQIFFTSLTPLWYIIISFILLGSVWAMGNTVTIIAAQTAVGPNRSSVATGTMVTFFNMGCSIGLAIAVVIYHFAGNRGLQHIFIMYSQKLNAIQFSQLEKLIANPAQTLQQQMNTSMHTLFNDAFMRGFSGAMSFLLSLSILILLSVLTFKRIKKNNSKQFA